ncbi:sensor domain-containing diguanylate cyclase [Solimonas sp. K1W22B-7]|uniref:sensor domain-containing diguanylate cyclase n=1 Tax=Solimonas sp. K1W22B-7 TaxID=2303331 RepID=UPI0013C47A42|nr:sensor domain-containing diguanylate cyclase [Solimonas sp. K1W22B-7]
MSAFAVPQLRSFPKLAGLFLLVALSCWAAIALTPPEGRISSIWLANGLLVGLLAGTPAARWWPALVAGYGGNVFANVVAGDPLALALSLALCNSMEVALALGLLQHRLGPDCDLRRSGVLLQFGLFAVLLAPAASALLAATILSEHGGTGMLQVLAVWYPADVLGMAIVAPLVMTLRRPAGRPLDAGLRAWLPASALLVAMTVLAFGVSRWLPPLLFLTFPPLLFMVLRHGNRGAAVGVGLLAVVALLWLLLPLPEQAPWGSIPPQARALMLQAYLVCASGMALTVATLLEQRGEYEQGLQQALRRLRSITDHLPAYVGYIDRDGRFRFANSYYRHGYGLEPEDMIGRPVQEMFGQDMLADFAGPLASVMNGQPVRFERIARELPGEGHQRVDLVPDHDERGNIVGFYSLVLDITERKRAELHQAASEQRLRMIADNLPAVIAYIDAQRVYRFCNRTHEAWFGKASDDVIGRHMERVLPPEMIEAQRYYVDCAMHGARAEGSFSLRFGGQTRHIQVCFVPDRVEGGAVRGLYMMMSDVTVAKRAEQRLQQLARFDPLTGLANRRELHDHLGAALNRIQRYGGSLALLFIDVDHFKGINDQYGHAAGDEVLQEIALRLRGAVRNTDTVARVAGDEFVIILEQLRSSEEPQFVARKLLASVGKPFMLDQGTLQLGVSIGIALGSVGDSADQLLRRADRALYAAKDGGRNTSRVAEPEPAPVPVEEQTRTLF